MKCSGTSARIRGIPPTLDLAGQAEFILGYHHQRAADLAAARANGGKHETRNP